MPSLALPAMGEGKTLGDYLVAGSRSCPIPSQDGEAALVTVPLDATKGTEASGDTSALVEGATAMRDEIATTLVPQGLNGYVGGPGGLIADFAAAFAGIDGILLGVALLVVLVILLIVYRSPILPFAVLLSAVFGLSAASLVVYQLALNDVITCRASRRASCSSSSSAPPPTTPCCWSAASRRSCTTSRARGSRCKRAWRGSVEPIVASAATVILGLLCLLLAELRSTSGLGPVGALGIAGALLASLTFLPAVLLLFGRQAFWPFAPKLDHVHAEDVVGTKGIWGRVADLVGRHPRRTWVITLAALLIAAAFAPTFKADGATIDETFLNDTDSITAQRVIGEHFPAGSATPVQIVVPQADAGGRPRGRRPRTRHRQRLHRAVPPQPGQPAGAAEGRRRHGAGAGHDQGRLRQRRGRGHRQPARSDLDAVSTDALVGGNAATNLDVHTASGRDLRVIVPTILLVIFLVLALLLRSLVAPLLLVAANVVSFAATIGISALVFQHLFGFASSDPSIVLYGFVFLVALGIDYSIFLMTRVREESKTRGTRPGILVGLAVTGGVITSAGIVLAATFSALAVLPLVFLVQIAFIVAFGVLLDTFVVRSLLVPASAYDIGPPIWWPRHLPADRGPQGSETTPESPVQERVAP